MLGTDNASAQVHSQRLGDGTGGQNDVLALEHPVSSGDRIDSAEHAVSVDELDLVALNQPGQATMHFVDDSALELQYLSHIDAVKGGNDSPIRGLVHGISNFRGSQQSLGRYATAVQTGAANFVRFDQSDAHSQRSCSQSTSVTAISAA